jgi:3-hydroxyisobutyrate dehydrogenase-like beta-hydroxyacid dehydrogenase
MGRALAERLREQGCEVAGWNRSPVDPSWLTEHGVTPADSPRLLARHNDFVLTALFDDRAVLDVYCGPDGLLQADDGRCTLLDLSTVAPRTALALAKAADGKARIMDVPVLGTVKPARQGRLIALAGGSADAFTHALPLLERIARRIEHVGPSGSGAAAKLAINIPMCAYWAALADCFALAGSFGVDRDQVLDIIADSPAALVQLPLKMDVIKGRGGEVAASIDMVMKDLALMLDVASAAGMPIPMIEAAVGIYGPAAAAGRGQADVASVAAAG